MGFIQKASLASAVVALASVASGAHAQGYWGQFATFTKTLGAGSAIMSFNGSTLAFTPNPMVGTRSDFDDGIGFSTDPGAKLSFGPLTGAVKVGDFFHWKFSGNFTFKMVDAANQTLLQGAFTDATLDTSGGQSGNLLSFGGVTYTGGSYLTTIKADYPWVTNKGDFAFSLSGLNYRTSPSQSGRLGANPLNGRFQLGGNGVRSGLTGNFNIVSQVPEPGEWAAMGMLTAGLGGLVVRARRKRA